MLPFRPQCSVEIPPFIQERNIHCSLAGKHNTFNIGVILGSTAVLLQVIILSNQPWFGVYRTAVINSNNLRRGSIFAALF